MRYLYSIMGGQTPHAGFLQAYTVIEPGPHSRVNEPSLRLYRFTYSETDTGPCAVLSHSKRFAKIIK